MSASVRPALRVASRNNAAERSKAADTVRHCNTDRPDFVRGVLAAQVGYCADGLDIVDADGKVTKAHQSIVNRDGHYSQDVIELHAERFGSDYRLQTDGEHPVDHREMAAAGGNGGAG